MNGQNSKTGDHMLNEADIGSGERTPGQKDTDKIIEQIGTNDQEQKNHSMDQDAAGRADKVNKQGHKT